MRNRWMGAVISLALACPVAYADMMPAEEGSSAQESTQPKQQHHKKRMHKKGKKHPHRHHAEKHPHHKHHAKKHQAAPEGHETPAEQKIDAETDLNNSRR